MLYISGDLDFSNVMSLYQQSLSAFASQHQTLVFDFSGLRSTNSVVMAIIIDWMRHGKRVEKSIQFMNLSADIMSLAKASGLDKVIATVSA
jgi:anti-anti-sigma factor